MGINGKDQAVVKLLHVYLYGACVFSGAFGLRIHDSPVGDAKSSVMCQGMNVTVMGTLKGSKKATSVRWLGTRAGPDSPWNFNKVQTDCLETCTPNNLIRSSLRECPGCPCTTTNPKKSMNTYLQQGLRRIEEHCPKKSGANYTMLYIGLKSSGALIQAANQSCKPQVVRIIEPSSEIIDAASLYFGLNATDVDETSVDSSRGMQVLKAGGQEGAEAVMRKMGPEVFDAIVVDCMSQDIGRFPESCRSTTLYSTIRGLLKPRGMLAQWIWPENKDLYEDYEMRERIRAVFRPHWRQDRGWVAAYKNPH